MTQLEPPTDILHDDEFDRHQSRFQKHPAKLRRKKRREDEPDIRYPLPPASEESSRADNNVQ